MAKLDIRFGWAAAGLLASLLSQASAQDATWLASPTVTASPGVFDFNANANWTPATAPGSLTNSATATFGTSSGTNIGFSVPATALSGLTFTAGASNYAFTNTGNLTFDGGGIVIDGGGATITNSSNTITASVTQFLNTSSAGSTGITNNTFGLTTFNNNSTAANAVITNNGNGTTTFNDGSSGGRSNIINNDGGSTIFASASTAGHASITNNAGGETFFNTNSTAATAAITNVNSGLVVFNDSSTAANAVITNTGNAISHSVAMSQFGDTSTAGNAVITNNGNGTTTFVGNSTAGSAVITNNLSGNNIVQFFNNSSAGSAAITNNLSGTNSIQFFNSSSAGSAILANVFNGTIGFSDTSSAESANISNAGNLNFNNSATAGRANITNNGSLNFFSSSTAGNASITNNFTVNFNSTSTAGNAIITNNAAGGSIAFSDSSTAGNATISNRFTLLFLGNSTAGNAAITNLIGTVDFSGSIGPGGNNKLSAGSIAGSGMYYLGANELTIGSNNLSTTMSGVITDCGASPLCQAPGATGGSLVKVGTGTLTLAGLNSYTGPTTVNSGALEIDGSIVTSLGVTVNAGGTLSGAGTVSHTTINSGGVLAPGPANAIGALSVSGNLAFQSGAIYLVQATSSAAATTSVSSTATLGGTVVADPLGRLTKATTYTILSANALSGTFTSVSLANNFATNPVLSYVGNTVELTLGPGLLSPILSSGANTNQKGLAAAIDTALLAGSNLPAAFNALFTLSGSNLQNGLTQVSGETATGSQQTTFDAMGQFMGAMTDPFMNRTGGVGGSSTSSGYAEENAYAAKSNPTDAFAFVKAPLAKIYDPRWSVWAAGFGGSQSTSGDITLGSNNTTSRIFGTAVGADYLFSADTIAGFAMAGGGTSFSVANGGTGRSDLFQMGAYVRHNQGPAYISAALAYGWQDITTNRTVMVAGIDQLRAQFNANAWSGRLEGGYRYVSPSTWGIGITPYAAAQFVTFDLPAYAEQAIVGSNNFALNYGAQEVTDARSELGIRTDKSWFVNEGLLTFRTRFAWAHDYDPGRSIGATFQTLPGASFVVNGAAQASDSALTTASIEMKWRNGWSAAATFEGEFSNVTNSYAGKGVVRYQW